MEPGFAKTLFSGGLDFRFQEFVLFKRFFYKMNSIIMVHEKPSKKHV